MDIFTIEFDKAQAESTTIAITKGDAPVDGKVEWSADRTSATFTGTAKFANGEYTVTVTNGTESVKQTAIVEDERVDEIVIKGSTALTNDDASSAYIYYDVYNQYKESIKTSTSINWTVSSCDNYKVDKASGRITANKAKGDKAFTYGETIYVVGVNVKSGKSVTASVTVGMAQAISTVEMVGFVNKNKKTELVESLPKNFAKDTWYLAYAAKDQNDNPLEAEEYDASKITFISDNPLLMESSIKTAGEVYSINGTEYASVLVNPGNYVDKGGEVNITAVSNKTGVRTTKNFKVGENGVLQSLVLDVPNGTVADGDGNDYNEKVKIPYVAKDTTGKTVTNYDTIVRSSNALTLNAGDNTTLEIVEENDGTAGIYWHDSVKPTAFTETTASDNLERSILLSSIVVGGEANNVMLNVSDMRRPTAIKSVNFPDNNAIVDGNTTSIDFFSSDNNTTKVRYLDQYGAEMRAEKAAAFFDVASKDKGFDRHIYGIQVKTTSADKNKLFNNSGSEAQIFATSGSAIYLKNDNSGVVNYTANLGNSTERATVAVKYSIVIKEDNGDFSDDSKVKNETYTIVDQTEIKDNITMNVKASKYQIATELSAAPNGYEYFDKKNNPVTGSAIDQSGDNQTLTIDKSDFVKADLKRRGIFSDDDTAFEIKGTTRDGLTISIPSKVYTADEDSDFEIGDGDIKNVVSGVKYGKIKWSDLYDANTSRYTRIDATKNLVVNLGKEYDNVKASSKVKVSDEQSAPVSIKFTKDWKILGNDVIVNPETNVAATNFDKDGKIIDPVNINKLVTVAGVNDKLGVIVYDQFGRSISPDRIKVSYKVSDIKESSTDLTYMANSFAVNKNNTPYVTISKAEIGDTYKITATVDGFSVSASLNVTVGSDTAARISTKNTSDTDETFRKKVLGMNR